MNKIRLLFFFLIIVSFCNAQKVPDSLLQRSYDKLFDLYNSGDKLENTYNYAQAYLRKALGDRDTTKILTGYYLNALLCKEKKRLQYYDSILDLTKYYQDETYPTAIYISQGDFYYRKKDFNTALDYYLKAKSTAEKTDNKFLIYNSNCFIGKVRDRTKDSIAALNIHRENFVFVKNNISKFPSAIHLQALYALANAYNNTQVLDSALYYNKIGLELARKTNSTNELHLLLLNDGTTQYYLKNYGSAIQSLSKARDYFKKINNKSNLSESLYFLGKSQMNVNEKEEAINNFKIIDTIFQKTNDLLPRLRDSYELLINYSKETKNLNQQLYFLNNLIKLDSVITTNESYLTNKLIKKYDIPKIVAEKEAVINELESKNTINKKIILLIVLVLMVVSILLYLQSVKKKKYKERFEAIIEQSKINIQKQKVVEQDQKNDPKINEKVKKTINVPEDIVNEIFKCLDKFEAEKGYLNTNVNIQELAKSFKTNANYLSKVINHYKKQNFTTYINYLRIDYVIDELQTNKTYRKFTIRALAREIGFKSSESFSKSFYKKTGIKPSYFIENIEKS